MRRLHSTRGILWKTVDIASLSSLFSLYAPSRSAVWNTPSAGGSALGCLQRLVRRAGGGPGVRRACG